MIITNKLNLPQPFVDAVQSDYKPTPHQYSATTILNPTRQIILQRRYNEKITQDVADMIWMLFGTALHSVLENSKEEETQFKEEYLKQDLGILDESLKGFYLSGKADLLDVLRKRMTDYKTTSVFKIQKKDYEDWRKQLLIYSWLFIKIGFEVDNAEIVALLKDWSSTKAKVDKSYPQLQVQKVPFKFNKKDFDEIEQFIINKFKELKQYEEVKDEDLPMCSMEERWNDGNKYAVKKKNNKRADRVYDTREEAVNHINNIKEELRKNFVIEERLGEDKRCLEYCSCCKFCPYYKEKYEEKKEGI